MAELGDTLLIFSFLSFCLGPRMEPIQDGDGLLLAGTRIFGFAAAGISGFPVGIHHAVGRKAANPLKKGYGKRDIDPKKSVAAS